MHRLSLAFVLWATVTPAAAQQLKLDIKDGRVDLEANAVQVRQILAEWGKVGSTRVVGGDQVPDEPLTLRLVDVPERRALDIILRNVAGYIAAPRPVSAVAGASMYDRLLIMAISVAPATTTAANLRVPNGPVGAGELSAPRLPVVQIQAAVEAADEARNSEIEETAQAGLPQDAPLPFVPEGPPAQGLLGRRADPGTRPPAESMLQPNPAPTGAVNLNPKPNGAVFGSAPGMIQLPAPTPARPPRQQ